LKSDHKAWSKRDLLRKGSLIDTGVDSGLGESCGLFDLREAEEFVL